MATSAPANPLTAKEILLKTKQVLGERGWCQIKDVRARLDSGKAWSSDTSLPICIGLAVLEVVPRAERFEIEHEKALGLLGKHMELSHATHADIFYWNDAPGRKRHEVDAVLDMAIAEA